MKHEKSDAAKCGHGDNYPKSMDKTMNILNTFAKTSKTDWKKQIIKLKGQKLPLPTPEISAKWQAIIAIKMDTTKKKNIKDQINIQMVELNMEDEVEIPEAI